MVPLGCAESFEAADLGFNVVCLEVQVHPFLADLLVVGRLKQDHDVGVWRSHLPVDMSAGFADRQLLGIEHGGPEGKALVQVVDVDDEVQRRLRCPVMTSPRPERSGQGSTARKPVGRPRSGLQRRTEPCTGARARYASRWHLPGWPACEARRGPPVHRAPRRPTGRPSGSSMLWPDAQRRSSTRRVKSASQSAFGAVMMTSQTSVNGTPASALRASITPRASSSDFRGLPNRS